MQPSIPRKPEEVIAERDLEINELKRSIQSLILAKDPLQVLRNVKEKLSKNSAVGDENVNDEILRAMSLSEFEKGVLLLPGVPVRLQTFCIDFMRNLQKEYDCVGPSEKATAELVAVNFVRVLDIQCRMNCRSDIGLSRTDLIYLAILGKELDRANRQYLSALQTLKMMRQASWTINVKAQTAVVGQNQAVQAWTK